MNKAIKIESEGLSELWQVNKNISVYKGMLKIDMSDEKRNDVRDEIFYLETEIIPQLKFYDV